MVFRWRWTARLQHSECGALPSAADVAREWVVRGDSASPWRPWPAGADAPTSLWRVHLHVYQQLACRVPMRLITDVFSATFSPPRTCCGSNIMSQVWQEPCTLRTFIYSLPSHLFSPSTNIANVASQAPYIQPSPSHCCSSRCSRELQHWAGKQQHQWLSSDCTEAGVKFRLNTHDRCKKVLKMFLKHCYSCKWQLRYYCSCEFVDTQIVQFSVSSETSLWPFRSLFASFDDTVWKAMLICSWRSEQSLFCFRWVINMQLVSKWGTI